MPSTGKKIDCPFKHCQDDEWYIRALKLQPDFHQKRVNKSRGPWNAARQHITTTTPRGGGGVYEKINQHRALING